MSIEGAGSEGVYSKGDGLDAGHTSLTKDSGSRVVTPRRSDFDRFLLWLVSFTPVAITSRVCVESGTQVWDTGLDHRVGPLWTGVCYWKLLLL